MTKRSIEEIESILNDIENEKTVESLIETLQKKRKVLNDVSREKKRRDFLYKNGYFLSVNEIQEFKDDPNVIYQEFYVQVYVSSWDLNDYSDGDVCDVTSDNERFNFFKLGEMKLEEIIDAAELNWSQIEMNRDAFDEPMRGSCEYELYFYILKQPKPTITETISIFDENCCLKQCCIEDENVVEKESKKIVVSLSEWEKNEYYNVKKLTIENPFNI